MNPHPTTWKRKKLLKWARVLLLVAVAMLLLRRFEHSQVYHPSREFRAEAGALGHAFEELWLTAKDGTKLHGWYFPATPETTTRTNVGGASNHSLFVVLVCHGNAGNIGDRLDLASAFLSTGASVLLFDYRGYGKSEGKPSEEGTYLDAEAAYDWLRSKGFPPRQIVLHGESLGGAVATELARRREVAGLILQSTFTNIPDIGAELFPFLPVRWISRIKYDTHSKLPTLKVPLLILHSRDDSLIAFRHAERNYAVASEPKFLRVIPGDHNDGIVDEFAYAEALREFFGPLRDLIRTEPR